MEILKNLPRYFFKTLKWLIIIFISFIVLIWTLEFIADTFFDNAAKKDSCADLGGAWDHKLDQCKYHPNDPRSKNSQLFN